MSGFHPIEPIPAGIANGRCGAQRTVRVAQAERRLWAQKGDRSGKRAATTLTLSLDGSEYRLGSGDSIYHDGDCEHGYRNDADAPCIYYLAMDIAGGAGP